MIITSISYQAVKNLGNCESERLEATATVEDGEDPVEEVKKLRRFVHWQLTDPPSWMIEKKREAIPDESDDDPLFDTSLKSDLVHDTLNESDETGGGF